MELYCKSVFCLGFDNIDIPRIGLLLFKPFEYAFDNSHICFLFDAEKGVFSLKILKPDIKNMTLKQYIQNETEIDSSLLLRSKDEWKTFIHRRLDNDATAVDNLLIILERRFVDFEGKTLIKSEEKCFGRCLSFQASMARMLALEKGWITKDEVDSPTMFSALEELKKEQLNSWLRDLEPPESSNEVVD